MPLSSAITRQQQQLSAGARVDWSHRLSQGLIFGWHGGRPFRDFVTDNAQSNSFNAPTSVPRFGSGFVASSAKVFPSTERISAATTQLSVAAFVKYPTGIDKVIISKRSAFTATGIPFEFLFSNGAGGSNLSLRVRGNQSFASQFSASIVPADNEVLHVAATWSADGPSAGYVNYYKNGEYVDSNSLGPTSSIVHNSTQVAVGDIPGGGAAFVGSIFFVGVWAVQLSVQQIRSLYQNPYQLFRRTSAVYWPSVTAPTLSSPTVISVGSTTATPQVYVDFP